MKREGWRPFLARWSSEWLVVDDEHRPAFDEEVVRSGWLGFPPAAPEDVADAEARLGCRLPPSLREFLCVTNGWRQTHGFVYQLAGTGELAWLRDTSDAHWIEAWRVNEDGTDVLLERSLRLSLSADAAVVFLDPEDRDADGEWAAYELRAWSGMGPERAGSFRELMERHYASFHALFQPPCATRDHWDARVEDARRMVLAGEIDEAWVILEEAETMGRERAELLLTQLAIMQGQWYRKPLSHLLLSRELHARMVDDPVLREQLLAVVFAEPRFTHGDRLCIDILRRSQVQPLTDAVESFETRWKRPDFRPRFGDPDLDAVVNAVIDRLAADPAFRVLTPPPVGPAVRTRLRTGDRLGRARAVDAVWPKLLDAVGRWRPACDDLIAPIALLADPILGPMITPERGRELLSVRRGTA